MSLLALLIPALIAAVLDLTVGSQLDLFGGRPAFAVAVVAVWAVLRRRDEALVLAPLTGLLLGLLGNEPLGASVIGLAPVVLIAGLRDPSAVEGRFAMTLIAAAAGAALYTLVVAIANAAVVRVGLAPLATLRAALAGAVFTTPVAGLLYFPMTRVAWRERMPGQFRRY